MKFTFQFESLLNIRRHRERQEQQKLGALLEKRVTLNEQKASVEAKLTALDRRRRQFSGQNILAVTQQYEMKHSLQKKIWALQRRENQLKGAIHRQRQALMQANKETQMLEKLRQRDRAVFVEKYQQMEQKQQNEIATQMYNRTR